MVVARCIDDRTYRLTKQLKNLPNAAAMDFRHLQAWLGGISVVATDLAESFRAGLSPHLDHATRVADPFHGADREPLCRSGPPSGAARDARASGSQARPVVSDPQAVALRLGTPRCTWRRPAAPRAAGR